ncbi:protein kinase MEC1 [Aspergillus homomorphus CBS 101889]|uniref:Serine/threonine-protein kinase MEC1 n=1 Tax=Aspergillus homomorphus (strain CBS 101889) TaxID=1450537 RepID=A0A395I1U7_ASPHC|nr:protein kinase [Aspergillus homomorphus CBS 101889]RAL13613.1 protein kinase [Aspergillus homomorphus CBS 101889]
MAASERKLSRFSTSKTIRSNVAETASSTLAAQFVPRLSSQCDQTRSLTKEAFSQLRNELLGGRYSRLQLNGSIIDVAKLLCIALKAGLEPCIKDRSLYSEDLQTQLSDCLDIIQTIIEKAPLALVAVADPEILGNDESVPLYSWLLVRLLQLASSCEIDRLSGKVNNILSSIASVPHKHARIFPSFLRISSFLRVCTMDLLRCLEAFHFQRPPMEYANSPSVVKMNQHFCLDLDHLRLPHASFNRRLNFGTFLQSFFLCTDMLKSNIHACHHSDTPYNREDKIWLLNGYQRLWDLAIFWIRKRSPASNETSTKMCVRVIATARTLCTLERHTAPDFELAYLILQKMAEILATDDLSNFPVVQLEVSQLIDILADMLLCTPYSISIREKSVLLNYAMTKERLSFFQSLEPRLQASIELLSRRALPPKQEYITVFETLVSRTRYSKLGAVQGQEFRFPDPAAGDSQAGQISKRRCFSRSDSDMAERSMSQRLLSKVFELLCDGGSGDLKDLLPAVSDFFGVIAERRKCEVLHTLGLLPCAIAGSLTNLDGALSKDTAHCHLCDDDRRDSRLEPGQKWLSADGLCEIFVSILPTLSRTATSRITAISALRRVIMHAPECGYMRLATSVFGDFYLQSMKSSVRELRIMAGCSVTSFVQMRLDRDIRHDNFIRILDWLRGISDKKDMCFHETCILTLCRLAELSCDEEMNIILLRLVEYLGHSNPFVCSVAYTELSRLAQRFSVTPAGLFRPFWRTLSVAVVKNFQSRPYMAEQLCDLLGMKVDDFLRLTEVHVLPYLVFTHKREIIARVGATYKEIKTPFDVCSEKNNLAAILAFLLSQPSSNPEDSIMSTLSTVDLAFRKRTLAELLRIEPILIACDLLKNLGDSSAKKGARFHQALQLLATLVPRKSINAQKRGNLIGHFIEEHVLGIITQFANAINDFQVRQSLMEKRRNLAAIGEMIKIAQGHVSSALPQICACLRSAFEIEELCNHAFKVWGILISTLQEEEVEPLVDQTMSTVLKYWDMFTEETQNHAYDLVAYILRQHGDMVRDIFNTMSSLSSIPKLANLKVEINGLRGKLDVRSKFLAFVRRSQSENAVVIEQTLEELVPFLSENEEFVHASVLSEQPDPVVSQLARALLDCCVKFNTSSETITLLSAQCLGRIGCLDPNRVDTVKEKKDILVLSNFDSMEETFDFILFFLQHILVEAFLSASNTRAQGFLAYAMQNMLRFCNLDSAVISRSRDVQGEEKYRRWMQLPEAVRNTLTPFLTSKYTVTIGAINTNCIYPLFSLKLTHGSWLRSFVQDLLRNGNGDNARLVFSVCSRVVKGQDISIASFLLPFAVLNRIVGGTEREKQDLQCELIHILSYPLSDSNSRGHENILLCSQSIFEVLDYLSRWLQGKKKQLNSLRHHSHHASRSHKELSRDMLLITYTSQVKAVEALLGSIPPEIISRRAVECKSFSRALFHWEQYIRQSKGQAGMQQQSSTESLYQRLQDIYSQIDEPDGIEGISTNLHALNIDEQVLEHRKAGRWATAQSWYELQVQKDPDNGEAQWNLLTCLKESGQQDAILTRFDVLTSTVLKSKFLPFAVEACWITGNWDRLHKYLQFSSGQDISEFDIGVALAFDALRCGDEARYRQLINGLRLNVAKSLTANSVTSLQSCHNSILRLHALCEIEFIVDVGHETCIEQRSRSEVLTILNRRLDVLGGYISDKQYLLGLRRAIMELTEKFTDSEIAAAWLASARLLRKGNYTNQAYQSMLHAARLKDKTATIEHARLLWKDGHHRKAIQTLEGAIIASEFSPPPEDSTSVSALRGKHQNVLGARAHLLLAKWTDRAGQTQSDVIVQRFREAIKLQPRWEKAHYYLGKHYNKILDSEKAKPLGKEAQTYLTGEVSKLVVDNYLRSLAYGNKYVFQSLPKVLTLWLEHASIVEQPFDPKRGDNEEFQKHTLQQRKKSLEDMHAQLKKYIHRVPAALLFTILPQVLARICHPNTTVYDLLTKIVAKAVNSFPQQGLWTVLAVVKSSSKDRASRGISSLQRITDMNKKSKAESSVSDMRAMINQGQKFSDEMLRLCIARIEEKVSRVNLRALGFNHKVAPCRLVVPFQAMLTPSLPASHDSDYLKSFRAFPKDSITIEAVLDDAQILNSLQKPRRISIRGSDGRIYNILCKPKDDLRKDQRLMEFNNMINRFLKRDVESSKRRMYIKTYAVTPLNEECGLIEWVDNLRTLRELVIKLLKERGISPNYNEIRQNLNEACSDTSKLHLFKSRVLAKFPPVLYEWFVEMFPEREAWFAARVRYTRSCAVMSMVGYVLGLGDRHGENILFEEGTGGVLHVDFNCLFDKGLTFDKPELVPFRLTQNMVDAFGAYGYNGPYRKTCEISLGLLRHNEDALMTVLETFLHDPTTDFIGKKRRAHANVPDTPTGVLENVRTKLRGLLPGESVPLSVDGHVDALIVQATNERNLAAMYIGWCSFF